MAPGTLMIVIAPDLSDWDRRLPAQLEAFFDAKGTDRSRYVVASEGNAALATFVMPPGVAMLDPQEPRVRPFARGFTGFLIAHDAPIFHARDHG